MTRMNNLHAIRQPVPEWPLQAGEMDAQAIVGETIALLEAVRLRLGGNADRAVLIEGLRYCLGTSGAAASANLGVFRDRTRRELARKADQVSEQIVDWAQHAVSVAPLADLRTLEFESLCAGHRWEDRVTELLTAPPDGRMIMQLYNEWIHQLVILRDVLLPLDDWRTRTFPLAEAGPQRGLRAFQLPRLRFETEIVSHQLPPERSLDTFRSGVEDIAGRRGDSRGGRTLAGDASPLAQARMLDNELLRVFLAVVQCGSFTTAAQMLNRTQAAVSMQIKRLEELVQVRLLARENRLFQLTAEGQTLRDYAQRMLDLNDEALTRLATGVAAGPVRVATNEFIAAKLLPELAARFQALHPAAWIETRIIPLGSLDTRAAAGDDDLVLDLQCASGASAEALRPVSLSWYTAERRDPAQRTPVPLALHALDGPIAARILQALEQAGLKWTPFIVSESTAQIEAAVRDGNAVAVLPVLSDGKPREGLRALIPAEGFPVLPPLDIVLSAPGTVTSLASQKLRELLLSHLRSRDYDAVI